MRFSCVHRSSSDKEWLPSLEGILRPHPCCANCGVVKNISYDRAKEMGYYVNVLSEIKRYLGKRGFKLSKAQLRLILKELEDIEGFSDSYCLRGSVQKSFFIEAVRKYSSLSPNFIESFLS